MDAALDRRLELSHWALVWRTDLTATAPVAEFLRQMAQRRELEPDAYGLGEFMNDVWPDGVPTTVYAANIGNDATAPTHYLNLLLRPVAEGPLANAAAIGGLTLALHVQRRSGRLEIRRVEVAPHVRRRDFEVSISAPMFWRDHDLYMGSWDLEQLANLPFHRALTRDRLRAWRDYLEWKEALIRRNQVSVPYQAWRWEGDTVLAFLAHEDDLPERRLVRMELGVAPRPPDSLDEDPGSVPRQRRDPKIRDIGEVEGTHRLNPRDQRDRKGWSHIRLTHKHGRIRIRVEEERAERLHQNPPPSEGLLMSSIAGDLATLRNQRFGVDRLNNSQGFSPRLTDFIFRATSASVPLEVAELPPVPGGPPLNEGQRQAVARAMAAPDLCLIQGPPGTGKTTVIADLCLRAAIDGKRVLVASQTNLAVDNALARLSGAAAVRPLRLGKADRIDEEFRDFLAENVIDRWFVSIGEQCRTRMRAVQDEEAELAQRESAVHRLDGVLAKIEGASREVTTARAVATRARESVQATEKEFAVARQAAQEGAGELNRLSTLRDWGEGKRSLPPVATGSSVPHGLAVPSGIEDSEPTLGSIDRIAREGEPLRRVLDALSIAVGGGAHSADAAHELRLLREEKRGLVDSDELEDLHRLRLVNRRIKELEAGGWNQRTGEIHRAALVVWPGEVPGPIARVIDALRPSPQTDADLEESCDLVAGRLDRSAAAADLMRLAALTWKASVTECRAENERLSKAEEQASGALDAARFAVDEAMECLQFAQDRHGALRAEWEEVWRETGGKGQVPPPTADALATARGSVEHAREASGARLALAARWRAIQGEWLERLGRVSDSDREQLQALYMRRANVVGMTCNEAGKRSTWQDSEFRPFDIVIVDEVSKATPPELILPLLLGEKTVLVGDHRQLPPMFRERDASFGEATANGDVSKKDYERFKSMVTSSLFQELFEEAPDAIKAMLWTQYRMHPTAMAVVNQFYEGRLEAGPDEATLARLRQHHLSVSAEGGGRLLTPGNHLLWLDSSTGPDGKPVWEQQYGTSKVNLLEVDMVVALLLRLGRSLLEQGYGGTHSIKVSAGDRESTWGQVVAGTFPGIPEQTVRDLFAARRVRVDGRAMGPDGPARAGVDLEIRAQKEVGVITFYGAQLRELRVEISRCKERHRDAFSAMELRTNTVDRFQGMEKPIVIASLVRSKRGKLGAFVREYQRINVGLSRAQQLLVVVGAEETWKRATVPLPPLDGGPAAEVPAYREILDLARRTGGRRIARQVLYT